MKKINNYKAYIIIFVLVVLTLVLALLINKQFNNDGMNNSKIYNIKYRVYQNNKWSKYSKNGMVVGDKKSPIQNIDLKYNDKKGKVYFYTYSSKWSDQIYEPTKNNVKQISGIKIETSNTIRKKYDVCYRTYNKKDKWLNWTCNGSTSGNKDESITAIEIKIIPKNVVKFDYLKDYNKKLEFNTNF